MTQIVNFKIVIMVIKKYKEIISYIDLLTFLSFPEGSYRNNGL